MNDARLRVYLNDHIAGAVAAIELVGRCSKNNPGGPLGTFLAELKGEIEEDLAVLRGLHDRVGGLENPVKKAAAWAGARLGGMKLNTELLQYSDLSRLEELEGLLLGVRGKMALWRSLGAVGPGDDRFGDVDFPGLLDRAQRQYDGLEAFHLDAARQAFSTPAEEAG